MRSLNVKIHNHVHVRSELRKVSGTGIFNFDWANLSWIGMSGVLRQ